jgi:predicted acetyltransferase
MLELYSIATSSFTFIIRNMPLHLRWVGEDELDRVAQTRMLCYAHAGNAIERYRKGIRDDPAARPGDHLLAERDGEAVGTATSLSMTMWVRGTPVPCQGVANVGTIKTHRRRTAGEDGVASQVMHETIRMAREREQVVSALMPFRGSFYEHFGYGIVERRNEWTLPLSVLPRGNFDGLRFYRTEDLPELARCRQRVVEAGQCDIERPENVWESLLRKRIDSGFVVVDRPDPAGPVRGYLCFEHFLAGAHDHLRVTQNNYADISALKRQLHFLSSLRDQYAAAVLTLPVDLPLNWLLQEHQLPHRPVNHATAELRQHTRMAVRVLDHKRFLEALHLPSDRRGRVTIGVRESEGPVSQFEVDLADGGATVCMTTKAPEFTCPDSVWAATACGDITASRAVELGIAEAGDIDAVRLLDVLSVGAPPFCHEYF